MERSSSAKPAAASTLAPAGASSRLRPGARSRSRRPPHHSASALAVKAATASVVVPAAGSAAPAGGQTAARIDTCRCAKAIDAEHRRVDDEQDHRRPPRMRARAGGADRQPHAEAVGGERRRAARVAVAGHSQPSVQPTASSPAAVAASIQLDGEHAGRTPPCRRRGERQPACRRAGRSGAAAARARALVTIVSRPTGGGARQPVRAALDLVAEARPLPAAARRDSTCGCCAWRSPRSAAIRACGACHGLSCARRSRRSVRTTSTTNSATPAASTKAPTIDSRFRRLPAEPGGVGVDAPRHAEQAGDVHRKEGRG